MRLLDKGNLQLDMTKLGFEPSQLDGLQVGHRRSPTAWCWSPGPTGSGKTTTLYSALQELNTDQRQHQHRRGSGRVQPARHQPGADARRHRPQLRGGAALVPAPGPGHHHGRRDPRLRDRARSRSRRRSPATWCSRRCTPTTRRRPSRACSTWASSRSWSPRRSTWSMAQRLARKICADCKEPIADAEGRAARLLGAKDEEIDTAQLLQGRGLRDAATAPATRAASRSTRSCVRRAAEGAGARRARRRPRSRRRRSAAACAPCACAASPRSARASRTIDEVARITAAD